MVILLLREKDTEFRYVVDVFTNDIEHVISVFVRDTLYVKERIALQNDSATYISIDSAVCTTALDHLMYVFEVQ